MGNHYIIWCEGPIHISSIGPFHSNSAAQDITGHNTSTKDQHVHRNKSSCYWSSALNIFTSSAGITTTVNPLQQTSIIPTTTYVQGLGEKFKGTCNRKGIQVHFKHSNTIITLFMAPLYRTLQHLNSSNSTTQPSPPSPSPLLDTYTLITNHSGGTTLFLVNVPCGVP